MKFLLQHWKEGIHLLFRTKRFGVNNQWYSNFNSMYGWPTSKIILSILKVKPVIDNYRLMKLRASCGFLPKDIRKNMGWL